MMGAPHPLSEDRMSLPTRPEADAPDAEDLASDLLFTTPARRTAGKSYAFAAAAVALAFGLRYLVHDELLFRLPFMFFVPATLLAAWYGGLGPGIAAMVAGLLLGDYFFLEPHEAWGPLSAPGRMAVGSYTLSCLVGIGSLQWLHVANRKLERRLEQLRRDRDRVRG
jgi:K+-sensing histidine kinase KdpD